MITSAKMVRMSISKPRPISPVRSEGLTPSTPSVVDKMIRAAEKTHQAICTPDAASSDETKLPKKSSWNGNSSKYAPNSATPVTNPVLGPNVLVR